MSHREVSVAVPVVVDRAFSYRVPEAWAQVPEPGTRVSVPFGPRILVGVVRPVTPREGPADLKEVLECLDAPGMPALPGDVVHLCEWAADYYVAPVGEVYRLALPGLLMNADARLVTLTTAGRAALEASEAGPLLAGQQTSLTDDEARILAAIDDGPRTGLPVVKLSRLRPRITGVLGRLEQLAERGLCEVRIRDATDNRRTETHYRRTDFLRGPGADEQEIRRLIGRSKLRRAMLDYLESQGQPGWVGLSELRGPFSRPRALLRPLVEARLVASEERPKHLDPFQTEPPPSTTAQRPTADQAQALETLLGDLAREAFSVSLLHGVTGSGKTEVYLQLIAQALDRGRSAIVLVPEIALTPQLADRFRARFGDRVAILHSGLTPAQRVEAWQEIRDGTRPIVIGARSAVFAPVQELGVIVVDEEHDSSFKQEEGVRYNARDLALIRARETNAVAVLGSATPSLESYEHARSGRYRWLRLHSRPSARPLPAVELVPLSSHRPDPMSLLTAKLKQEITEVVERGEQAILFLNRRGFTTALQCEACGELQHCPDCSAPSMTYHLDRNRLVCHLCGHIEAASETCGACGAPVLVHQGVGTERVELALTKAIAGIRVLRLDRDTSRGRRLLEILDEFRQGRADVLVGTQMLSKGHDFPGVTLVGILQADHGLAMPDPRAAERTFQLLTQVSGRAGRGDRPGRVLVQVYAVKHPAIVFAAQHDYEGFAQSELADREQLGNPPFGYLALVRVVGKDERAVEREAMRLAELASSRTAAAGHDEVAVLGPVASPIARINRRSRWQLLLRTQNRPALRRLLRSLRRELGGRGRKPQQLLVTIDPDPQSFL